jgi:hypothetical protein
MSMACRGDVMDTIAILKTACTRSNSLKDVPTAQNCLLKSMGVFGCDLSEKPLKNLAKVSDFQAGYEGSIPFTRSKQFQ